jgi:hypothetical protein
MQMHIPDATDAGTSAFYTRTLCASPSGLAIQNKVNVIILYMY